MQLRLEFQTTRKGSLSMLDYIMKLKTLADNLFVVCESVSEKDHILQILGVLVPIIIHYARRRNLSFFHA